MKRNLKEWGRDKKLRVFDRTRGSSISRISGESLEPRIPKPVEVRLGGEAVSIQVDSNIHNLYQEQRDAQ